MIGKRPNEPVNLVEEGELILTLNIFYPVIFQKVSDSLILAVKHFLVIKILYMADN